LRLLNLSSLVLEVSFLVHQMWINSRPKESWEVIFMIQPLI
jgi:hypothetical protein